ncbi:MAG: Na-K-Cl cotransporter [Acidobacteriota bacterium]
MAESPAEAPKKFGAFSGVFTPSILTILGVVMYLRFGWVVGNAGLGGALLIVVLAHLISFATGLSVASIATNRRVGVGGAYFMISRALGPALGAAIGFPLFLAQALSVTFYIVGFAESLSYLFPGIDVTLVGTVTCLALTLVSLKSANLAIKVQFLIMGGIALSLASFFSGHGPNPPETIVWWRDDAAPFGQVFAVFFPAVTGIMAGVSMSGDLQDPSRALPRGTIGAILVGFAIYMIFPIWLALNADLETLRTDLNVVWDISRFPSLIYVGIWGATLSSALGSILAAPRTLQALASDRLFFSWFAKGSGPSNEPRNGLILTFVLAEVGILLGSLDAIAPVLTMFFLVTYGMTNLAFGLERWAASPSFRPTFQPPAWIGLAGGLACFYVMGLLNFLAMIAALVVCGLIYVAAERRTLTTTYGDARHGIWSALVQLALQRLRRVEYHPMNWRPNLIILGGNLAKRAHLLELGSAVVQDRGLVTYFHLIPGEVEELADKRKELQEILDRQFAEDYPNVFCRVDIVEDLYRGIVLTVQSYGVGGFEANAVMLGWLRKPERTAGYVKMLRDVWNLDKSLLLVKFDPERGYGLRRRIDIWWRGLHGNGALMLLLAFLLTCDERWRQARVRVITVVEDERRQAMARANLTQILQKTRLEAEPVVLLQEGRSIHDIMDEESRRADLVMVGMRMPEANEDPRSFLEQYNSLLDGLPTTLLVASAPEFRGGPVLFDQAEKDGGN